MTTIPRKYPAPLHATPAERPGYCTDCGTAPCQHAPRDPQTRAGVDLVAVLALLAIAIAAGLLLGYHAASWALTP